MLRFSLVKTAICSSFSKVADLMTKIPSAFKGKSLLFLHFSQSFFLIALLNALFPGSKVTLEPDWPTAPKCRVMLFLDPG